MKVKKENECAEKYLRDLECDIIAMICERLEKISKIDCNDIKELLKLQNIGGDVKKIEKKIGETVDKVSAGIYNIVEECVREYYAETTEKYGGKTVRYGENSKIVCLVEGVKKKCAEEFAELMQAEKIGFENCDGKFESLEHAYRDIVNEAVKKVMKNEDVAEYAEEVMEKLTKKGLVKYVKGSQVT